MATAAKALEYPHIVKTPGVRGGKARIDGTRICVIDVALAYQQGHRPEEIQTLFSSRPLTLAEVMSALAYHYDHPHELEEYLERERQAEEDAEKQWATLLAKHGGEPPTDPTPEERAIPRPFPWPPAK
jgi:uncharacterized protein (DUF433 family)